MLKGIHPLLSPDLLHALAGMGHGDEIGIVDANFPAASLGPRLIELRGATSPSVLEAILTLFTPVPDPEEMSSSLLLLLELADSFITYRSRYRLDPMLPLVLDLLLLDETNPRSLAYQLSAIARHLESLPDAHQGSGLPEDRRLILALLTSIRLADVEAMAKEETGTMLERLLMDQLDMLPELSNEISRHYFNVMDEAPHRDHTRVGPSP